MENSSANFTLKPADTSRLTQLCGELDANLHKLEKHFNVKINNRGHDFFLSGEPQNVKAATTAIKALYKKTSTSDHITPSEVNLTMQTANKNQATKTEHNTIRTPKLAISGRTKNQANYVANIKKYDVNFAIGPAGTGKTYLAVAYAVQALEQEQVHRIIVTRPAVEAGEHLGYLPGDIAQKFDPYLRPIYDALYDMLGFAQVNKLIESGIIEIAPLAFMRGRTLNEAIIILDEAQNTTIEQMKMFLTRIGFGSKAIITGDITQIDLPKHLQPGLKNAIDVLKDIPKIGFNFFQAEDIVRHPLVQRIVQAYERYLY